jgi:hypothetical protein
MYDMYPEPPEAATEEPELHPALGAVQDSLDRRDNGGVPPSKVQA